jgi:hypothetical protein
VTGLGDAGQGRAWYQVGHHPVVPGQRDQVLVTVHHQARAADLAQPVARFVAEIGHEMTGGPGRGTGHVRLQQPLDLRLPSWLVVEKRGRGHPERELRVNVYRAVPQCVQA